MVAGLAYIADVAHAAFDYFLMRCTGREAVNVVLCIHNVVYNHIAISKKLP